jgi:hypothetical protein
LPAFSRHLGIAANRAIGAVSATVTLLTAKPRIRVRLRWRTIRDRNYRSRGTTKLPTGNQGRLRRGPTRARALLRVVLPYVALPIEESRESDCRRKREEQQYTDCHDHQAVLKGSSRTHPASDRRVVSGIRGSKNSTAARYLPSSSVPLRGAGSRQICTRMWPVQFTKNQMHQRPTRWRPARQGSNGS